MPVVLYMVPGSPPCRAVLMTAEAVGVKLDKRFVNIQNGDHLTEKFKMMNPQHTIPVLEDDGLIICESHAINAYLVDKYAKNDSLYPKDCGKRAMVDQRLHFDTGVMFSHLRNIVLSGKKHGAKEISQDYIDLVIEAYEFLEAFLQDKKWLTGENVTIADISLLSTVSSLNTFLPPNSAKFPNITRWMKQAEEESFFHVNKPGNEEFKQFIETLFQ